MTCHGYRSNLNSFVNNYWFIGLRIKIDILLGDVQVLFTIHRSLVCVP